MGILKQTYAGLLALALGATSVLPTMAAPMTVNAPSVQQNVDLAQGNPWRGNRHGHFGGRHGGWGGHHGGWRGGRHHGGGGWWHGHRGSRYYRHGWRRHSDGWWYPLAAFGAGAVIGGAMTAPGPRYANDHVRWCAQRYRSYRASDNTFQPNSGPRRQCVSP